MLDDCLVDQCGTLVSTARDQSCHNPPCGRPYISHHNVAMRAEGGVWDLLQCCSQRCLTGVVQARGPEISMQRAQDIEYHVVT